MKSVLERILLVGLFAMSYMACSSGGDGGPTPPPEPTYKYFAYLAHSYWGGGCYLRL
jgi:hypothetical protein